MSPSTSWQGGRALAAFGPAAAGDSYEWAVWVVAGTMLTLGVVSLWPWRKAVVRAAADSSKAAQLQAALDEAETKVKGLADSQRRFVKGLAEEIREPLAAVVVHSELLLASSHEPAIVQRYARSVAADTRHVCNLVDSFLRLARLEPNDTSHHVPVHVHDLVVEAMRRSQAFASSREVAVVSQLAETGNFASVEVLGDAALLQAMIENLVRHAVLSAPRETRVDLQVRVEGEEVLLSVRDRGEKIDPDDIDSVFDGLFRASTPQRSPAGARVGLAIARRVAEHHRGSIRLREVAEGGSEFEVHLPRWRSEGPLVVSTIEGAAT